MDAILTIGGSSIVFILCLIPIMGTWIQSALFLKAGLGEAKTIGMNKQDIHKVITNSIVFSILPTIAIIITMGPLMQVLGRYIPWLRLSVVGSAAYESIAADLAIKSYGLGALGEAVITEPAFVTVVFSMTIGILLSPILSVLFLKKFDRKLKTIQTGKSGFATIGFAALFIGLLSVLMVPITVNIKNPVGILTLVVSGIVVLVLEQISKQLKIAVIKDFAFPTAMVVGMASALFWSKLFIK